MQNKEKQIEEEQQKCLEKYEKDFENLSKEDKKLLAYIKMIELENGDIKRNPYIDEIDEKIAIMMASDFATGFVAPLLYSILSENTKDIDELCEEDLKNYKKILTVYKSLAEDLQITNPLELSELYTYLLWNGYFSVTKAHTYTQKNRLLSAPRNSIVVMKGKGVCLEYSQLLSDYLKECGKKATTLVCHVPTEKDKISYDYRPDIERNISITKKEKILSQLFSPIVKPLSNHFGNHATTLIDDDRKTYIFDATNLSALNIVNSSKATLVNGTGEYQLKPTSSIMILNDRNSNDLYKKLLNPNQEQTLSKEEFISSFDKIIEIAQSSTPLLEDAYASIHSTLEQLTQGMDERYSSIEKIKEYKKKIGKD